MGWAVLQELDVPITWRAAVAGVGVAAPLLIGELRERRKQDDEWDQLLSTHLNLFGSAKGFPLGYLAVYELACYATRRMVELPNTPATLVMVRPD